jgi:hypothetical protein
MPEQDFIGMLRGLREVAPVIALMMYPEETARFITPALGVPDAVMAWCYNSNVTRRFRLVSVFGAVPKYERIKIPYKNLDDKRIQALMANGSTGSNIYELWSDIHQVHNVSK